MNISDKITPAILGLEQNMHAIASLLSGLSENEQLHRPEARKWNLLEIICHLYDEEREDFRARIRYILENESGGFVPINPVQWVEARKYAEQDFDRVLNLWKSERMASVEWLNTTKNSNWEQAYMHPKLGNMTASMLLQNWLAHDFLHIRQILKNRYTWLSKNTGEDLSYAGNW